MGRENPERNRKGPVDLNGGESTYSPAESDSAIHSGHVCCVDRMNGLSNAQFILLAEALFRHAKELADKNFPGKFNLDEDSFISGFWWGRAICSKSTESVSDLLSSIPDVPLKK